MAYLSQQLAPDRLGGAVEGSTPRGAPTDEFVAAQDKHINLEDVAYATIHTSDAQAQKYKAELVRLRRRRVRAIVWRAAAIHDEVWTPSGSQLAPAAALATVRIGELLDRRLHSVERMTTQVATHMWINGGYTRGTAGELESTQEPPLRVEGSEDWRDDFRGRPFEYPRVHARANIVQSATPSGIAGADEPAFSTNDTWRYSKKKTRLEYNVPPTGIHLRSELQPHWRQRFKDHRGDSYDVNLVLAGSETAAGAVDLLFKSQFNWWNRSWLFCDHVLSALHIDALLFALRRAGRLAEFNQIGTRDEYIQLSSHVNQRDEERLMAGTTKNDIYFDNTDTTEGDLQVGDHLIMWNSFVYGYISDGEWQLENALVVDVVSDPTTGSIARKELRLQGHGTPARSHDNYQQTIRAPLEETLSNIRKEADAKDPSVTSFDYFPVNVTVVKWDPFQAFQNRAWWLILKIPHRRMPFETIAGAKASIPKAIELSDAVNPTEPFPFPVTGLSILFPLYEPKFKKVAPENLWLHYFAERAKTDGDRPDLRLAPVLARGSLLPTLWQGGSAKPLPIVRPRVSST